VADYAHHITTCPTEFSDLPAALLLWMCPGAYDYSADEYLQSLQSWFQSFVNLTGLSKLLNAEKEKKSCKVQSLHQEF
jgi:hypothetical protein